VFVWVPLNFPQFLLGPSRYRPLSRFALLKETLTTLERERERERERETTKKKNKEGGEERTGNGFGPLDLEGKGGSASLGRRASTPLRIRAYFPPNLGFHFLNTTISLSCMYLCIFRLYLDVLLGFMFSSICFYSILSVQIEIRYFLLLRKNFRGKREMDVLFIFLFLIFTILRK
jgi:hypothetical protein